MVERIIVRHIGFDEIVGVYPRYEQFLREEMDKFVEEVSDGCDDNYRVTEVGDEMYEMLFDIMEYNGCCADAEKIITAEDGTKFKIGFNYGH